MPAKKTTKSKTAESKEPAGAPKVFDVAKPGETAADASSRPLIVGHGSIIKQDPMVVDPAAEPKPASKRGVSLQPVTDTKDEAKKADSKEPTSIKVVDEAPEEKPEEPAKNEAAAPEPEKVEESIADSKNTEEPSEEVIEPKETVKPEEESTPVEEPKPDEAPSEQPEPSEVAATNALANELVAKKAAEEKAKEATKKADEFQALISSKKYFVNIHQSATSGGAGKWILLLLLLLVAGTVVVIDAGLVETSITLPFDLIQNQ